MTRVANNATRTYYISWINDNLGHKPTEVEGAEDGVLTVQATSPQQAFNKFQQMYPNFKDGEGDFYVIISNVPRPEEGKDLFIEAGIRHSTKDHFFREA